MNGAARPPACPDRTPATFFALPQTAPDDRPRNPRPRTRPDGDHPAIHDGIEAVVLDFDGTLADTTPSHEQALRAALQPHGLDVDHGWYLRHAGLSIRDLLAELPGVARH